MPTTTTTTTESDNNATTTVTTTESSPVFPGAIKCGAFRSGIVTAPIADVVSARPALHLHLHAPYESWKSTKLPLAGQSRLYIVGTVET